MMPQANFNGWVELAQIVGAMSVATGAMSWFRRGSTEEDKAVSDANDYLLDSLSDADKVNKIKDETWNDVRDQISVEQAQDMHEERSLRRWPWRN